MVFNLIKTLYFLVVEVVQQFSAKSAIALSPLEFWINLDGNIEISDRISNTYSDRFINWLGLPNGKQRSFITLARLNLKPYFHISPPNRGRAFV